MALLLRDLIEEKLGVLMDIEGTLIKGVEEPTVYQDGIELLGFLEEKHVIFVTNLARRSTKCVSKILNARGINADSSVIVNPTKAALISILDKEFNKPVRTFLISEGGHYEDIVSTVDWIEFVREEPVDVVLLGASRDITYDQLNFAFRVLLNGAKLIVLGGELWAEGSQYGCSGKYLMEGAFAKMLEITTGVKARYVGKPNKEIFEAAIELMGVSKHDVIMIGDNIQSDIMGAYRVGIDALLIDRTRNQKTTLMEYVKSETKTHGPRVYVTQSLSPKSLIERII